MYADYVEYDYDDNDNNDKNNNDYYYQDNNNNNKLKKIAFIVLIFVILVLLVILVVKLVSNRNTNDNNEENRSQLIISKDSLVIDVGETYKLEADFWSSNNEKAVLYWESIDPSIATVDQEGNVVGISEGEVFIIVSYGEEYNQTCIVTVTSNSASISSISLGDDLSLKVGETVLLQVSILPLDAKANDLVFTSSNMEVATVDENGRVTANDLGTTSITVSTKDGSINDTINVNVIADSTNNPQPNIPQVINPTSLQLFGLENTLTIGNGSKMVYNIEPGNATNNTLSWTSSNKGVAIVSNNGIVTGISAGKSTITATTVNGISSSVEVEVIDNTTQEPVPNDVKVNAITFNDGSSLSMTVKQTKRLYYTITPDNATNKNVKFTSSDPSVVMVASNGIIAAVKMGEASVTVTTEDGLKSATIKITVTN